MLPLPQLAAKHFLLHGRTSFSHSLCCSSWWVQRTFTTAHLRLLPVAMHGPFSPSPLQLRPFYKSTHLVFLAVLQQPTSCSGHTRATKMPSLPVVCCCSYCGSCRKFFSANSLFALVKKTSASVEVFLFIRAVTVESPK